MSKNIQQLEDELIKTQMLLNETRDEQKVLKKAVWDLLNHASLFLVLLDQNLNVCLSNWSLAHKLGFKNEKELVGKCWLDFIKPEEKNLVKNIYQMIVKNSEKAEEYKEIAYELVLPDNTFLLIKWFNVHINGKSQLTLSIGIQRYVPPEESEDAVRSYYRDIIDNDATIIKAIRETLLDNV